MKRTVLLFIGMIFISSNIFADALANVNVSPVVLTNLSPGTTVSLGFRIEVTAPFMGTTNGCTIWDAGTISATTNTPDRINVNALSVVRNPDGCSAIPQAAGCPETSNAAVDGSVSFQVMGNSGSWDITFTIEYYSAISACKTIQYSLSGSVLPVELSSFEGRDIGEGVELKWTTANEVNNEYFTVERSIDGKTFESVADINGAGDSTEDTHYSFIDKAIKDLDAGMVYYRLKQTDFDGTSTYSEIINIRLEGYQNTVITNVVPLGGQSTLKVNSAKDEDVLVSIFDLSGQLLQQQSFFLYEGDNELLMEHGIQRSGIYLYNITSPTSSITKKYFH